MENNREFLLLLYERNDRKRRKMLYQLFGKQINMDCSIALIAELINIKLEKQDLISANDIRYCRFHFRKNSKSQNIEMVSENTSTIEPPLVKKEIRWTNPDEVKSNQYTVKSKYSK